MKRIILLAIVLFVFGGFASRSFEEHAQSRQLVIKISSPDPDTQVAFSAAYLFSDHESNLVVEEMTTPVSITAVAESVGGIFRSVDGNTGLRVELLERTGTDEQQLAMGEGPVVMLSESHGRRIISEHSPLVE